ncbi:MAG: hypothetical protein HFE95_06560 [Acutalibacter sp.]|jgi:hypothetical protein|nr:hypothetical protein [Acutalibacter sp.]
MSQKGHRWVVLALSFLVLFCAWKMNAELPGFPDIYFLDDAALWAINCTPSPSPEPAASLHWERITAARAEYTMCRRIASGVSFSRRILDAYLPEAIQVRRSIKYVR